MFTSSLISFKTFYARLLTNVRLLNVLVVRVPMNIQMMRMLAGKFEEQLLNVWQL